MTPDKYLTLRYAGASGDFNPIHVDEEFARAVGLPGRILHGLWTMAQVARAQTQAGGGPGAAEAAVGPVPRHGAPEQEVVVTARSPRRTTSALVIDTVAEQDGNQIIRNAEAEVEL